MKKVISLVLALLIPLLGCATTSPTERIAASIHAVEESEWVDLASPRRSPESARQILEEVTGSGGEGSYNLGGYHLFQGRSGFLASLYE